jgi:YidC/Oxa1 family membrane protein insertase
MVVQQRLNPKPADPVQAAVIGYMPYIFLFLFASFPAGLVIYWAWNNTLSIAQQSLIQHRIKKHGYKKKPAKKAATGTAASRAKKK